MNLTILLQHPLVRNCQLFLGHAAIGLGTAWVILFTFELWRVDSVSWYLDLNLLLLLTLVAWLVGAQAEPTARHRYVGFAISAILVVGSVFVLTIATPSLWLAPPLALLAVFAIWRAFPSS